MLDPTAIASGARTGEIAAGDVEALHKALTAGYGTDVATLTGGAALRIQSLDPIMQSTIQENDHFRLFNMLAKSRPGATVDEWTEQDKIGGFLGGSTNTELGVIQAATGSYARRVGMVKYLMTQRQVSLVQTLQKTITDSEAVEYGNGALQLLSDAEYLLFEGDESVIPTEFSGLKAQLLAGVALGQIDSNNVIDMDGKPLEDMKAINQASAQIRRYGNFGRATDIFFNQDVQSDFDNHLDPAFRVSLNNGGDSVKLGTPVTGIRTSGGHIKTQEDVFIRSDRMKEPFECQYPVIAAAQVGLKPQNVTVVATADDVSSKFDVAREGNYVWLVVGTNAAGGSTGFKTAQTAVGAGKKAVLTITRSAAAQETGYIIYRSRQNGGQSVAGTSDEGSDFREMARIPVAGATTTYTDLNREIPGTTESYVLNMTPGAHAINWRQMLPMLKFPLYPTNQAVVPWAQLLFGYLRISKRKHHVLIRNILPRSQAWRPFEEA